MPPKTTPTPVNVSWQAVKATCSQNDMERLACLGLIYIKTGQTNKQTYIEMAAEIGGTTKPESHRRVLDMLIKKIKEGGGKEPAENGGGIVNGNGKKQGGKGKDAGRKRKMTEEVDGDEEISKKVKVERGVKGDEGEDSEEAEEAFT